MELDMVTLSSRKPSIVAFMETNQNPDLQIAWDLAIRASRAVHEFAQTLPRPLHPTPGLTVFQGLSQEEQDKMVQLVKIRSTLWLSFASELLHSSFPHFDQEIDELLTKP